MTNSEIKDKIIELQSELIKRKCKHDHNCWINQNWDEARMAMSDTPTQFRDASYYGASEEIERKSKTCSCGLDKLIEDITSLKSQLSEAGEETWTDNDIDSAYLFGLICASGYTDVKISIY